MTQQAEVTPQMVIDQVLTTPEAADYLGLKLDAFKYHVHRAGNITPAKVVGRVALFTRGQLDAFAASKRGPGRPEGSNGK